MNNAYIGTISKINFAGKWVEFWFKEKGDEERTFDQSTKAYMLHDKTQDIAADIANYGYVGLQTVWVSDGNNMELFYVGRREQIGNR